MKKIIPIFLIIIITINHFNIINVVMDFSVRYKKENCKNAKSFPGDKESEPEKENKGKEKAEDAEKFFLKNNYLLATRLQLPGKDKFVCFSTKLNAHPYHEDDIHPPQAG
ncbi:MAG: hypothetical protein ABIS01_04565 [Ferruginibacter sp.]